MIGITAVFIDFLDFSFKSGEIGLCELKLRDGKLVWQYIGYSASLILEEEKIPDQYSPTVFIERKILQGIESIAEFKEEDLRIPFTEEVWEKIKKIQLK